MSKPVLFLSHASSDEPIAKVLQDALQEVFAGGVGIFVSSVPGNIRPGDPWFERIHEALQTSSAAAVLVTPTSMQRPWVWFEIGALWERRERGDVRMYPLCVREVPKADLPEPLRRLQALSLGEPDDVSEFLSELCKHFGFGDAARVDPDALVARMPIHDGQAAVPVVATATDQPADGAGPYAGYSDNELVEVIRDQYLNGEWSDWKQYGHSYASLGLEPRLFGGKLVHYSELDTRLGLPPGTSRRLLKVAAEMYPLEIENESQHTVRFRATGTM